VKARFSWLRLSLVIPFAAGVVVLLWWRGPDWNLVADAFRAVRWEWVVVAVGFNLLSILARALAWQRVIHAAIPPPRPSFPLTFSAFCVGLFANAVLPGRVGELARVAVLTRRFPGRRGLFPTLVSTVFAHRLFDVIPVVLLALYVIATAKIPAYAVTGLIIAGTIGLALLGVAFLSARRHHHTTSLDSLGIVRRLVTLARHGLGVMRSPLQAAAAVTGQCVGWLCQLVAVWCAMRAFHIHEGVPAAALVLVLMNVFTIFPLWPGNVGLVQQGIAAPLKRGYDVAYAHGIAFGFGLQAIEASVGVGIGLVFLGKEGLSFAMLRVMPDAAQTAEIADEDQGESAGGEALERASVSG
jgi:glycosyltransferase 2 family protein